MALGPGARVARAGRQDAAGVLRIYPGDLPSGTGVGAGVCSPGVAQPGPRRPAGPAPWAHPVSDDDGPRRWGPRGDHLDGRRVPGRRAAAVAGAVARGPGVPAEDTAPAVPSTLEDAPPHRRSDGAGSPRRLGFAGRHRGRAARALPHRADGRAPRRAAGRQSLVAVGGAGDAATPGPAAVGAGPAPDRSPPLPSLAGQPPASSRASGNRRPRLAGGAESCGGSP